MSCQSYSLRFGGYPCYCPQTDCKTGYGYLCVSRCFRNVRAAIHGCFETIGAEVDGTHVVDPDAKDTWLSDVTLSQNRLTDDVSSTRVRYVCLVACSANTIQCCFVLMLMMIMGDG
jgi:hypothetical protein